ncbi:MAG: methyltransferase family protein [Promethearchaeota archaeon]
MKFISQMKMGNRYEKFKDVIPLLGVGPKILISISPFIILFGILDSIFSTFFEIPINYFWLVLIGTILISGGIFIFIYSEKIINPAYKASKLITTKIYAHVRHPMYAIWGLAILPGIICFFNSWLLFFILPFYYLVVRLFIRKEEKYLLKKYGEIYAYYKKNVNAFFPKFKKYKPE